jgi:hypothetical protein
MYSPLVFAFVLLCGVCNAAFKSGKPYAAVYDSSSETWKIVEGKSGIAWAGICIGYYPY